MVIFNTVITWQDFQKNIIFKQIFENKKTRSILVMKPALEKILIKIVFN